MCQLGGIQGGNEGGEVTSEFEKSRENTTTVETTPEGLIESGYRQVQAALASDLLERLRLLRSREGRGDYEVPIGKYGIQAGEA